jgi:sugar lactone lactonase YvrE
LCLAGLAGACASPEQRPLVSALPTARIAGELELVAALPGAMPTGIAVSRAGRIFVSFPRWGDPVPFTVAEIRNGIPVAYPSAIINSFDRNRPGGSLVSVQSLTIDASDRLWLLDTGSFNFSPVLDDGAKLVAVDLASNRVEKIIGIPADVALPTSYLNDLRLDLRHGAQGVAYITDSSDRGPNAIIVVDLASGASMRRLVDHRSTRAEPGFVPYVEGRELMQRRRGQPARALAVGADGLALSADGTRLYYCPLASRRLYSVDTLLLRDPAAPDDAIAATVRDEGMKPASDGLESDAQGRVYATAYELNAIVRRTAEPRYETLVHDPRVLWPSSLALAPDGHLYFTSNQLNRLPAFNGGADLRQKPYAVFRVKVDGTPLQLEPS